MITNNSNNYYVFLNVFMFRIMSMPLRNINPQKEIFHYYDFPVYTTSKYRDPKLDTQALPANDPIMPMQNSQPVDSLAVRLVKLMHAGLSGLDQVLKGTIIWRFGLLLAWDREIRNCT